MYFWTRINPLKITLFCSNNSPILVNNGLSLSSSVSNVICSPACLKKLIIVFISDVKDSFDLTKSIILDCNTRLFWTNWSRILSLETSDLTVLVVVFDNLDSPLKLKKSSDINNICCYLCIVNNRKIYKGNEFQIY